MLSDRPSAPWPTTGSVPSSGGLLEVMEPSRYVTVAPSATSMDFAPVDAVPQPSSIVEMLREYGFENGEAHPLDEVFSTALRDNPRGFALAVLGTWELASVRRPDLLLLLSRLPAHLAATPLLPLLRGALGSSRMRERDAAIRTLEAWGTEAARELLMAHSEVDVRLADYLRRVLDGMARRSRG